MKIKITKQEKEIEGEIIKGRVTPFGTSAHIPFSKKHLGKSISTVVPDKPMYIWLLKKEEKKEIINLTKKIIKKENGMLEHYRLQLLEDFSKEEFKIDVLEKLINLLEKYSKKSFLVKKVKELYDLN